MNTKKEVMLSEAAALEAKAEQFDAFAKAEAVRADADFIASRANEMREVASRIRAEAAVMGEYTPQAD